MTKENRLWLILFVVGALLLGIRWVIMPQGFGKAYVREVPVAVDAEHPEGLWQKYEQSSLLAYTEAEQLNPGQTEYRISLVRTVGVWFAAFLTLFVLSFLIKDNPFYKFSESVFVGVSAAYWMVVGFWDTIVPNLIGKLSPALIRSWSMPGLGAEENSELIYLIPLLLGGMLLMRLSPKGGWISRWPMAFIIGTFCGLRLISFIHADFLTQIRNSIVPVIAMVPMIDASGQPVLDAAGNEVTTFDPWTSLRHVVLLAGIFTCLVYFFFSIEHKGLVGRTARVGIWVLMITFGAAFGYTVMGRIALLAIRIEYLFDDWLWLIDPTGKRDIVSTIMISMGIG